MYHYAFKDKLITLRFDWEMVNKGIKPNEVDCVAIISYRTVHGYWIIKSNRRTIANCIQL